LQLKDKKIEMNVTNEAINWLRSQGIDEKMGARPYGRIVDEHIKKKISREILFGMLTDGGIVKIDCIQSALHFTFSKK